MFIVGLTGGISSGKSTVSRIYTEKYDCTVMDADVIARVVVLPGKKAYKSIVKEFGAEVLNSNGTLNRTLLGEKIFNNSEKRKLLNSITHPEIAKAMLLEIVKYFVKGKQFIILDVPLLFETEKWLSITSFNVVVYCNEDTQLKRLMKRDNLSQDEAMKRINSQMSLELKKGKASHVIDNNHSLSYTESQLDQIFKEFKSSRRHIQIRLYFIFAFLIPVLGFVIMKEIF